MVSCIDKTNFQSKGLEYSDVSHWCGKIMPFLKVFRAALKTTRCGNDKRRASDLGTFDDFSMLFFLQQHEVVDTFACPIDDFASVLQNTSIGEHKSLRVPGILDSMKENGLDPFECIWNQIHVVEQVHCLKKFILKIFEKVRKENGWQRLWLMLQTVLGKSLWIEWDWWVLLRKNSTQRHGR